MTVLIWGSLGLAVATLLTISLYFIERHQVRRVGLSWNGLTSLRAFAPFFGLLWLVVALLIHVFVSNLIAHQDCGLSGDPYVTLPNGYVLGSHNTYDGYFKSPGFETGVPVAGPGYVRGIIDLQYSNGYFTGTQFDFAASGIRHFVYDTRDRSFRVTDPGTPSHWEDVQTSVHNDESSYWVLYERYRHKWPNYVLLTLILIGEGAIVYWVWKSWSGPGRVSEDEPG